MDRLIPGDKLTSSEVYSAWYAYSIRTLGIAVPINMLEGHDSETIVGHEVAEHDPPLQCLNGTFIRRLTLAFEFPREYILWS